MGGGGLLLMGCVAWALRGRALGAVGDSTALGEGSVEGGVLGASEQQWEWGDTAQPN
jgi:hypothetical protein